MNETYLYPYSAKEARERNELSLWRESHRANIACRGAIEDAIRRSFDGMHLDKDCITPVLLCDMAAPMLPCICPADALESNGSLAGVLAAARISENLIKHNLVTFKRNSCLAVLGLLERQNEYSTPPFTQKQVVELLDGLRQIAPYVIVDCGSYIANDILSAVALMEADSILRLANCDPKSVNYFASQLPLLDGPEWDMDKQYKVASNVKPYQAADHIGKVLGDTAFVLPYSQELEEQYLAGNLLADLVLKDSRSFRKELERIIAEVF